MTLDQYLETADTNAAMLGAKLGLSGASVSRIRKGQQNITLDLAAKIEEATGRVVTVADLLQVRRAA